MKGKREMSVRSLDEVTREYVLRALEACRWNRRLTSEKLGISPRTLFNWLQEWEEAGLVTCPQPSGATEEVQ